MAEDGHFDVVVVGAGPAGCVLANRLTEDSDRTVALLEAGPDYGPDPAAWPSEMRDPTNIFPESHPWGYVHAGRAVDHPLPLPRARVIGGSSTINACIWARGSSIDYDEWAALGNPGWSYADLLPYFRRAETDSFGGSFHGSDGPVPISRVADEDLNAVDRAIVAAARELGFPWCDDLNGNPAQHPCIGPTPKNVADGARMHAAFTYLAPVRQRPNLTVLPETLVDRVCMEQGRATGVRTADGREVRARQVILCAGAYGSPAILLRSGIGPTDHLEALGIPVVVARPGVGAHLLDHPDFIFATGADFAPFMIRPEATPPAQSAVPLLIKARSQQTAEDIDFYIVYGSMFDELRAGWGVFFGANLEVAKSQGRVRLTSPDPTATLAIDHGYFSDPGDLEALCDGAELISQLLSTLPLAAVLDPMPGKVPAWRDRDELRALIRDRVETCYHPSGTCKMGPVTDPGAVVDNAGRVYGVAGLRVADASVFPTIPRANIHCTVVAVAEKLADSIRNDGVPS